MTIHRHILHRHLLFITPRCQYRQGGGYNADQFRSSVRMCEYILCNDFTVYTITRKILQRSALFLWTEQGI